MDSNLNVLMITSQYMPDVYGGAEKQCRRLAAELSDLSCKVTILTSTQCRKESGYRVNGEVQEQRIYSPVAPDLLGRWVIFSCYWTFMVLIYGLKHRNSIDIVHCHQGKFGVFVGVLLGKVIRKPVICKIGNSAQHLDLLALRNKKIFGPLAYGFVKRNSPTFVGITQQICDEVSALGFERVINIPNGVVSDINFSPLDKNKKNIDFFFHARLEPIKCIPLLIQAFHLALPSLDRNVQLHIIGDGSDYFSSQLLVENLSMKEYVTFHGAISDASEIIKDYDIFVNASEAEGFSNSLLEALVLGKLLVSTPVSGATDAIHRGRNGVVSNSHSVDDLAKAIIEAYGLYLFDAYSASSYSRNVSQDFFAMKKIALKYFDLYRSI